MHVGTCIVRLRLPGNDSLKGKRRVRRSIVDQVKHRFDVAIAEVEDMDSWQRMTLGITCVSNSAPHANEMLSKVVDFIETGGFDAAMLDYEIEIIDAF